MKTRLILPAALVAIAGAAPLFAQTYAPGPQYVYPGERIYVPGYRADGALHGGWVAPGDDQLLRDTLDALAADRNTNNMTVTVVAKNGELIINGVANNTQQAAYVDRIAKRIAHGHVISQWTTQQG